MRNLSTALLFVICQGTVLAIPTVTLIPGKCGTTEAPSAGKIIQSVAGGGMYPNALNNCTFTLTAQSSSHRIHFGFNSGRRGDVGIIDNPNNSSCNGASIQIFDGDSISSTALTPKLCGTLVTQGLVSSGDKLTMLVLSAGGNGTILNFTTHYTSFTEGNCGSDFPCNNGRCISQTLKCDTTLINNCGDFSDNSADPPSDCGDIDPVTTAAPDPASPVDSGNLVIIAYVGGAAVGAYFLLWLLFKPGYLIWRMGCFRHLKCCSKCYGKYPTKNAIDTKPLSESSELADSSTKTTKMESPAPVRSELAPQGITKERHFFTIN